MAITQKAPEAPPTTVAWPAAPPPAGLRVLVVEDDPFTQAILRKRLSVEGYQVDTAGNGIEGWARFEQFQPDIVLSDWMMPEMDGRELCARIKSHARGRSVYFVLLTAKDKNEDKVSALDTGADEYLVKPCDGTELTARVRAAGRIIKLQHELSRANAELRGAMRRINEELQATSHIQRSLLPQELPEPSGYRFAAHYQPSTECSGDFYDVLELDGGRLGLVIGDVSGHGTPAMVAMAMARMLVHMEAPRAPDPAALLFQVNNTMCQHLPTGQYVTMFYGMLELATGRLVYSSAGHNPPLLVDRADGKCEFLSGCEGFPVKLIGPDMPYDNREIQLRPGQNLLLYTDGLVEAMNPEADLLGKDRFIEIARDHRAEPPAEMVESILSDLARFTRGCELGDDLSLLILECD